MKGPQKQTATVSETAAAAHSVLRDPAFPSRTETPKARNTRLIPAARAFFKQKGTCDAQLPKPA
jgi:hypothetical protein